MDEQREEMLRERAISHGLLLLRSRDEDEQETPYSVIDTGEEEEHWLVATRMDLDAVEDLLDQADGVVTEDEAAPVEDVEEIEETAPVEAVDDVDEAEAVEAVDDFIEEVAS